MELAALEGMAELGARKELLLQNAVDFAKWFMSMSESYSEAHKTDECKNLIQMRSNLAQLIYEFHDIRHEETRLQEYLKKAVAKEIKNDG